MALAARGARKMNGEEEDIADPTLAAHLRRRARRVHARSILAALVATALALLLP